MDEVKPNKMSQDIKIISPAQKENHKTAFYGLYFLLPPTPLDSLKGFSQQKCSFSQIDLMIANLVFDS